ncbi:MAG TPA: hypothetical protein VHG08_10585 [Longimicrobium sp.]|nr:hypothetical protein [Longimicrobium sp.]
MSQPILRPLGSGEILDGAFTLYRRNFPLFLATAGIPSVVLLAAFRLLGRGLVAAMAGGDPGALAAAALGGGFVVMVVSVGSALVMWNALTHQAAQAYTGRPASIADGLRVGMRRALPLLGSTLIAFLGLMLAAVGVSVVLMIVLLVFSVLGAAGAVVGALLTFLAWVAVFLAAFGVLFAVTPAIVVEGAGPLEAVERSFALSRDALGRVVGVLLVALLITYLPSVAVDWLTGGFAQLMNPSVMPTPGTLMTRQLLSIAVAAITTPFLVAVIVLLYFDRRVRTEALDVQMMADRLAAAGD